MQRRDSSVSPFLEDCVAHSQQLRLRIEDGESMTGGKNLEKPSDNANSALSVPHGQRRWSSGFDGTSGCLEI
jgi:hypothetical protein